ncbi:hypothetical protein SK128_010651, partial [Halocaridina rubra]
GHNGKEQEVTEGIYGEVFNEERRVQMALSCRSVTVIHLLAECRSRLPLCATSSLLRTHDVPQLLTSLLHLTPWKTTHEGQEYYFQEGRWIAKNDMTHDMGPVSRFECQIWVSLYSLLMDRESLSMYEITSSRRSSLLKLQGLLNETLLSQLPILEPFARWLASLSLYVPQQERPPPLVMTVRQLGDDNVAGTWQGKWEELSNLLAPASLTPSAESLRTLASNLSSAWNLDALETLLPEDPICALCGILAGRRCSRCKNQWYCRRYKT